MEINITLKDLSPIIQSLNSFVQIPLPAKYSWRLSKVMKKLQSEIEIFNESRNNLFKKYGEEEKENVPENSKKFKIREDKMDEFSKELNDLLSEQIVISFDQIPLSLIESKITIADMVNLEMFFVDDLS